jgi:surface antigen
LDALADPARKPAWARANGRANVRARGSALATIAVVSALFATAALPAYAFLEREAPGTVRVSEARTQNFEVAASADVASFARDAFSATTPEELAAQRAEAARLSAASSGSSYSFRVPVSNHQGDDYPWAGMVGGLSPLRYYYGECVDFVAWRLNRDAGSTSAPWAWTWGNMTPGGGSANQWQSAWYNNGWPVSGTPVVGAVADTGGNHVAYVSAVYGDGTVLLEEYNYGTDHAYSQRVISAGSATYLYPPG